MSGERRKDPRHVVIGIEAKLNGIASTIIDISLRGVRLMRPSELVTDEIALIDFTLHEAGNSSARLFRVEGRLIRATAVDVTYIYAPPVRRWEAMLRAHNTFAQTALTRI